MEWKTIQGYEQYEVSNEGQVRNRKTGKILKLGKNNRGYSTTHLCKDGKHKRFLVHRLVAIHFIPNPENLPQVNHIDENKENNNASNLEWINNKNNANYGTRNERVAKLLGKKVYCYELDQTFDSINEASEITGIYCTSIGKCCRGKQQTAGGMHWKYVENK